MLRTPESIVLGLLVVAVLASVALYVGTLRTSLRLTRDQHGRSPFIAWMLFVPGLNIFWHFFLVDVISASLRKALTARGKECGSAGWIAGMLTSAASLATLLIRNDFGSFVGVVGFSSWLVYWVQIARLNRQLRATAPYAAARAVSAAPGMPQATVAPSPEVAATSWSRRTAIREIAVIACVAGLLFGALLARGSITDAWESITAKTGHEKLRVYSRDAVRASNTLSTIALNAKMDERDLLRLEHGEFAIKALRHLDDEDAIRFATLFGKMLLRVEDDACGRILVVNDPPALANLLGAYQALYDGATEEELATLVVLLSRAFEREVAGTSPEVTPPTREQLGAALGSISELDHDLFDYYYGPFAESKNAPAPLCRFFRYVLLQIPRVTKEHQAVLARAAVNGPAPLESEPRLPSGHQ